MLRKALVIAAAIGLAGSLAPAASATTSVQSVCWGIGCNGVSPMDAGHIGIPCADGARTLETKEPDLWPDMDVELRYSERCHAVWARIKNPSGRTGEAKVIGYSGGQFAREELKTLQAYPNENAYTKMISYSYTVHACYRRHNPISGPQEWCTRGF